MASADSNPRDKPTPREDVDPSSATGKTPDWKLAVTIGAAAIGAVALVVAVVLRAIRKQRAGARSSL